MDAREGPFFGFLVILVTWAESPATFFPLSPQAWLSEGRCVREVTEPGALRMEPGDPITVIEGR